VLAAGWFTNCVEKHAGDEHSCRELQATHAPLGSVQRKLKSATYTTTVPGAPDGEYYVIQFDSSFEHKNSAVETITPMLDKDGRWKAAGYYLK
jgi:hypothetical protein